MKYLSNAIIKYLNQQVHSACTKLDDSSRKLIYVMPSFPAEVVIQLGNAMEDFIPAQLINIHLVFQISYTLGEKWAHSSKPSERQSYEYAVGKDWYNREDNLTNLRNLPRNSEDDLLVVILVGSDQVTDKSSLEDFYQIDLDTIWQGLLNCSFQSWIEEKLSECSIFYEKDNIRNFDDILKALLESGLADIAQISEFIQQIDLSSAQDGRDALRLILSNMDRFNLPCVHDFPFHREKFRNYINDAIAFFNYSNYLDSSKRNKDLNIINKFWEEAKHDDEAIDPDDISGYDTVEEFIGDLYEYVEDNDTVAKQRLHKVNFLIIRDRILKFKPKRQTNGSRQTIKKLSGNPVEVILHGLWLTLADFKMEAKEMGVTAHEEIKEIEVLSTVFKHDREGEDAQDREENAKIYLNHLIGGIDNYIQDHIEIPNSDTGDSCKTVKITSRLVPNVNSSISYKPARTGEPCLQFKVYIKASGNWSVSREFAWRLPETHSYRIAYDMFKWASKSLLTYRLKGYCLPCFTVPYYTELMQAKDDDETYRVLIQCLKSESDPVINLLDAEDIDYQDPVWERVQKLALEYDNFICKVEQDGFFSALKEHFQDLRKAYEDAYNGFIKESQFFGPLLFRAFLMLRKRPPREGKLWYWHDYESSAVVTVLHPALIEMIERQIIYLFTCFNYLVQRELNFSELRTFQESKWLSFVDLAKIHTSLVGILQDSNHTLNTDIRGIDLLHRIGNDDDLTAALTTRLLLRYDDSEEDEISDTALFQTSRDSLLFQRILEDYRSLHPHADDGISVVVYTNHDIQPVIAGIDNFIQNVFSNRKPDRYFSLSLTIFTENQDDVSLAKWINEWRDRWESADSAEKFHYYQYCKISVSQRIVSAENNYNQFRDLIAEGLETDIAFLIYFIKAGSIGNEFHAMVPYDVTQRSLQFPILEKTFCAWKGSSKAKQRARVLSNRQFRLSSLHSEVMARLRHPSTGSDTQHVVLGVGDFSVWEGVIDDLHKKCEWVVCIDPCIDERLIRKDGSSGERVREIIGFGSGVGPHGEQNYTISTEQFRLSDIKRKITTQVQSLLGPWEESTSQLVAQSILQESQNLSGLSLVKATGIGDYVRDFMAYSLTRKLLPKSADLLCDELVSLDAFRHWFDTADSKIRPDLLWLTAGIRDDLVHIRAHIIECKLARRSELHEEKAYIQLENGLQHLTECFKPRTGVSTIDEDRRPDRRYWWLQIHRLIASKSIINPNQQKEVLSALERLSEGYFSIEWKGEVITYWTDDESDELKQEKFQDIDIDGKPLQIAVISAGRQFIRDLCSKSLDLKLPFSGQSIRFEWLRPTKSEVSSEIDTKKILDEPFGIADQDALAVRSPSVGSKELEQGDVKVDLDVVIPLQKREIPDRIFLGDSVTGNRKVYWEFGHPELPNRHILIFGASGMGKTYTIQAILCELGIAGQNSLIVDYTNGFDDKQIEKIAKKVLHPKQHVVRTAPVPINPFRRQHNIIDDKDIPETASDIAQRVSGVFNEVYNFGDQQKSVLYSAIKEGLELLNWEMSLPGLVDRLGSIVENGGFLGNSASTLLSRIKPFVDISPFGREDPGSWEKLFKDTESRCHIIQLATYPKDAARLITEFSLIDLYWYYRGKGSKDVPRVIVLDEIQNLDHRLESPLGQFLTEGRKFGISLVLATQTLSNLQKDERDRLFQASHKLFFKPSDTEIRDYAQILQNATGDKLETWIQRLSALKKGECYSLGPSLNEATDVLEPKPFRVRIDSLESRFGNNK